ncbi:hypothetical protein [Actinomadura sp. KC06]|uniref:hypothetical protein n=1 Tax=Actinomadura sp. KC06 TaxID=2530369 RepID=UPI001404B2CA|nr:hypothetical protein [Actinomadura sp. KC06]
MPGQGLACSGLPWLACSPCPGLAALRGLLGPACPAWSALPGKQEVVATRTGRGISQALRRDLQAVWEWWGGHGKVDARHVEKAQWELPGPPSLAGHGLDWTASAG